MKPFARATVRNALWLAAVAALSAAATPAARAATAPTTLYDNLGASRDGSDALFGSGPLANSFSTAAGGALLGGVQLLLTSLSNAYAGNLSVLLLADAASAPGATLATLGSLSFGAVSTANVASYAFAPPGGVALAANTRYWVELVGSAPNAIQWSWSADMAATGVAGQYSSSAAFGVNANSAAFGPYQMAVQVSAVPEATPRAMLLAAFAAAGFVAWRARERRG